MSPGFAAPPRAPEAAGELTQPCHLLWGCDCPETLLSPGYTFDPGHLDVKHLWLNPWYHIINNKACTPKKLLSVLWDFFSVSDVCVPGVLTGTAALLPACACWISCSTREVLQHQDHQSTLHCFISCSFLHCQSLLLPWPCSVASLISTQPFITQNPSSKWKKEFKTHCRLLRRDKRTVIKSRLNLSWVKFNPKWKFIPG